MTKSFALLIIICYKFTLAQKLDTEFQHFIFKESSAAIFY